MLLKLFPSFTDRLWGGSNVLGGNQPGLPQPRTRGAFGELGMASATATLQRLRVTAIQRFGNLAQTLGLAAHPGLVGQEQADMLCNIPI